MRKRWPIFGVLLWLAGCQREHIVLLENDFIGAAVADNAAIPELPDHWPGLNGIARLRHHSMPERDLFVPYLAGLNYEATTLAGYSRECDPWRIKAEPRFWPMELTRIDKRTVELHQTRTPYKKIETWLRYSLAEDRAAIDFRYTFLLHQEPGEPPESWEPDFSAFFASYMNAPDDPHLYFFGHTTGDVAPRWLRAAGVTHGEYWIEERDGTGSYPPEDLVLDRPYMAGFVGGLLFVVMTDADENFLIWYSPNADMSYETPAWDFALWFPDARKGEKLTVNGRMALLESDRLEEVEEAYLRWRNN